VSAEGHKVEQKPEEARAIEALDAYVDQLRSGETPDKKSILSRYPQFESALSCLEELNILAQAARIDSPQSSRAGDMAETVTLAPGTSDRPADLASPQSQFGNYELLGTLGRGGMGVVYKARQKDLNRLVAIKMILANQLASEQDIHRFHAEARAAAGLQHPNILQIHEAGEVCGQHYFAMQYVEGPSLAKVIRQGSLTIEESARCIMAVARAVAYLHKRGIVHRDLKPANILLDDKNWPYVTDFGLVKMLESLSNLTSTGVIVGTPSYMAPEQAAGRNAEVGPLSDVYSLGAILYEMLTGRPAFHEPTPLDTLVQVLEGEPILPRTVNPRIPRELELICLKAMAKAPEQRYASAIDLADDLERFLRGDVVEARSQNLKQRVVRWTRQEPGLVFRLAVLASGGIIAQVYYQFRHPVDLMLHTEIMVTLGLWALASVVCQALIRRGWRPDAVRAAWLAADALMLTTALILDEAFTSPLVLIYGAFVVASGLWFRVNLVWITTALAIAGYATLLAVGASRNALGASPQHPLIVLIGLVVIGVMVASQVRRVRALSRYYEHRPMP
jgi:serine/threonine-protein kinase